ncbi:putative uncharacterized transposon-derived protein F52C9.6, partial [Varanus komodoensis]
MTCLSWVALHSIAHSFIELRKPLRHDKEVIYEGERCSALDFYKEEENILKTNQEWLAEGVTYYRSINTLHQFCCPAPLYHTQLTVPATHSEYSLGVLLNPELSLEAQVTAVSRSAFLRLWLIHQLRPYLENNCLATVTHALVTSQLDFCNALYVGLPLKTVRILQLVQNRAARLLTGTGRCSHITPVLRQLHWLPIEVRAQFKVLVITYKALNGLGPGYLKERLHPYMSSRPLRSAAEALLRELSMKDIRRSKIAQFKQFGSILKSQDTCETELNTGLKLKKVGKSSRPLRYDLNHIPDEYKVEVTNRFKELDLIDRVPEELWKEVCNIVQEAATKTIPKKKKCKKAKWLSEEALQIAEERREAKGKGEKERFTQLNAEFQRIARRDKKAFLNEQCKEIENSRIGSTRDLFKKIGDMKGMFHAKMGMIKDQNGRDLTEAEEIKKRWQDYTEELYKKELNVPDNHDGLITDLEPDILECEVKWALGSPSKNKASGEHIMRKVGLDESPVRIKIAGRNNNLKYADDTTLMAESEEELKSLMMRVKEESAKVGLKLNIKKTKIMASGPLTSWQIDGEEMEVVTDFIFLGSKITTDDQMLKMKLKCFGHLMRRKDSLEKSLMLGAIDGKRRSGRQRMRWLDGVTEAVVQRALDIQQFGKERKYIIIIIIIIIIIYPVEQDFMANSIKSDQENQQSYNNTVLPQGGGDGGDGDGDNLLTNKCMIHFSFVFRFSSLSIKTKSKNCLTPQADLQITNGKSIPHFEKNVNEKQEQISSGGQVSYWFENEVEPTKEKLSAGLKCLKLQSDNNRAGENGVLENVEGRGRKRGLLSSAALLDFKANANICRYQSQVCACLGKQQLPVSPKLLNSNEACLSQSECDY